MIRESVYYNVQNSLADFGVTVKERISKLPRAKTVEETVPYMDGSHDLTGLSGEIYFTDRTETVTFNIIASAPEELRYKISRLTAWLRPRGLELRFETEPGRTYRKARPDFSEDSLTFISPRVAELTVTFTCAPFVRLSSRTVTLMSGLSRLGGYICAGESSYSVNFLSSGITVSEPTTNYYRYSSVPAETVVLRLRFPSDVDSHRIEVQMSEEETMLSVTPTWEYTVGDTVTAFYILPTALTAYGWFSFSGYYTGMTALESTVLGITEQAAIELDPALPIQGTSTLTLNGVITSLLEQGYTAVTPAAAGTAVTQEHIREEI